VKFEVGLFELIGTRISVAFVEPYHIDSGADQLLAEIWERLRYLTNWPLMLYTIGSRGYSFYQTYEFSKRIRQDQALKIFEIDLSKPFYEYQDEPPF
jgi:hypothetical protein